MKKLEKFSTRLRLIIGKKDHEIVVLNGSISLPERPMRGDQIAYNVTTDITQTPFTIVGLKVVGFHYYTGLPSKTLVLEKQVSRKGKEHLIEEFQKAGWKLAEESPTVH